MESPSGTRESAGAVMSVIAVCMKWVDRRPAVDPITASVQTDERTSGASEADGAALEWALRLADQWGWKVVAATAGGQHSRSVLHDAVAAGADQGRLVPLDPSTSSRAVASALAGALSDADLILCGDWSLDRGSGSVPAFLAAELGAAQALGAVSLVAEAPGTRVVERRLDRGRRETLRVRPKAVVSLEGGTARLRRASLPRLLEAEHADIATIAAPATTSDTPAPARIRPYRPRPRVLPGPAPDLDVRQRIAALTGSENERQGPETLVLDPPMAARRILDQLAQWGWRR